MGEQRDRNRDIKMEEEARNGNDDSAVVSVDQQSPCLLRRSCYSATWTWNHHRASSSKKSYPPISSIPKTSPERLALASVDNPSASAKTILYLAYGSNLSAETFLGMRGIRPISQINVSAPAFDLTFNLPGIPYLEPCFANTRPRRIPKPKPPIPGQPPKFPPPTPSLEQAQPTGPTPTYLFPSLPDQGPKWSKGLYGVVYEVTHEDYATIIKTEGGGQGYHDVLTPCFELPPALHVPEKPPIPEIPKPFLAHTLYAPSLPGIPDDDDDEDDGGHDQVVDEMRTANGEQLSNSHRSRPNNGDGDKGRDPRKGKKKYPSFLRRLLLPIHRPHEDYAQPSARYLKLIRDGAREHSLPEDYQAYLAQLEPYTRTCWRQYVGGFLFLLFVVPLLVPLLILGRLIADEDGRNPRWLGLAVTAAMNFSWMVYDAVFKPLFGDGERTMPDDDDDDDDDSKIEYMRRNRSGMISTDGTEDEKNRLLSDW